MNRRSLWFCSLFLMTLLLMVGGTSVALPPSLDRAIEELEEHYGGSLLRWSSSAPLLSQPILCTINDAGRYTRGPEHAGKTCPAYWSAVRGEFNAARSGESLLICWVLDPCSRQP